MIVADTALRASRAIIWYPTPARGVIVVLPQNHAKNAYPTIVAPYMDGSTPVTSWFYIYPVSTLTTEPSASVDSNVLLRLW